MKKEEHQIQCALMKWLSLVHPDAYALTYAHANGGHRHPAVGRALKREGVKAGVPDLFVAFPKHKFHGLYIEVKTKAGKPTKLQLEWLDRLSSQGYAAMLCFGFDACKDTISAYLED